MRPDERDAAYIWDMLDSAKTLHGFVMGVNFYNYSQDKKLQLVVERALEIIGEAARRVSEAYRHAHSEIPWQSIIAQQNVLAHEYGEIKNELIWKVATIRIPELITLLEQLIPVLPEKGN